MLRLIDKLQHLIEPAVTALECELVSCELKKQGSSNILRVYVDKENGISLEECAKVSRQISAILDVEDPLTGKYILEVSSPGVNRPLSTLGHFQRFIGRSVAIRLRVAKENQSGGEQYRFVGKLLSVIDDQICLELESKQSLEVKFDEIDKANLITE